MSASITSPIDALNLTFGVEIECVIKVSNSQLEYIRSIPYDNYNRPVPDNEARVHEEIYHQLINNGILCYQPDDDLKSKKSKRNYDCWKITSDASISLKRPTDDDEHVYFQMELVSRILEPTEDGFKEIEKVLDLIKSLFTLGTNLTTSLHVHVGNQRDGFPIHTLKNLALTVVAFEHVIHSIHPDNRIDRYARWCQPVTFGPQLKDLSHFERIAKIERCKDIEAFVDAMNPSYHRDYAYNFQNLALIGNLIDDGDAETFKQTIEFRQHEGSCDFQEISSWVDFVTGLIQYCHHVPSTTHLVLCLNRSLDPSFTVQDLMEVIERSRLIDFYKSRLHLRPRPSQHDEIDERAKLFEGFSWDHRTAEETREDQE